MQTPFLNFRIRLNQLALRLRFKFYKFVDKSSEIRSL